MNDRLICCIDNSYVVIFDVVREPQSSADTQIRSHVDQEVHFRALVLLMKRRRVE